MYYLISLLKDALELDTKKTVLKKRVLSENLETCREPDGVREHVTGSKIAKRLNVAVHNITEYNGRNR